jgi:hypothetical protein
MEVLKTAVSLGGGEMLAKGEFQGEGEYFEWEYAVKARTPCYRRQSLILLTCVTNMGKNWPNDGREIVRDG